MTPEVTLFLPDESATAALARRLAVRIAQDRTPAILFLNGQLGAGKTAFARAFLRESGVTGRVKSPTYALMEPYVVDAPQGLGSDTPSSLYFYHFDFYRFTDPEEWREAGFEEYFDGRGLCLVEWPDKVRASLRVEPDLELTFHYADHGRHVQIAARTERGIPWLAAAVS